ncbi:MAG: UpxY family transcription antiterminator [Desulforegulaceae bacterium]|jgi:transcription elongation factor/antiterminator RfaH|nr:UpxY family transcription antiterminator [Desulforegulaceae bacterium]
MSSKNPEEIKWYVLHTRSRFENVVKDLLLKKDIEVFLPKVMKLSQRKDRRQIIEVPMFPGYLFVKSDFTPEHRLKILKTTGAVDIIGTKNGAVPVKNETIESLILFSASREQIYTGKGFKKGQEVIIKQGPLAGVKGIFEKEAGKMKVIVQIDILGRYAYTEVNENNIKFLDQTVIIP